MTIAINDAIIMDNQALWLMASARPPSGMDIVGGGGPLSPPMTDARSCGL